MWADHNSTKSFSNCVNIAASWQLQASISSIDIEGIGIPLVYVGRANRPIH